ncbi:amino acid ABC transporter substrate-binding protein [Jeongeupia chitinilytica]|uniref:Amino acid ABC transporter substrate-binding protein n=1 Tax=Jeongeupia chitinilytica TaxID=1041641 RepID=A0ABQ3GYU3_9NEIS|nr:amino acid ABC transporter substrate-binding protein [Jeongeupia chitinilytica]
MPGGETGFDGREGASEVSKGFRLTCMAMGVAGAMQVHAAETTSAGEATLGTVSVVGNWLDDASSVDVLNHPGARTYVSQQVLTESAATNVREVLRRVPGVQVQENNGTGGSDISLNVGVRGLTSRLSPRSTILLDGVPLAVAPYGQPQLSMAPLSIGNIEAIDVVRGGGSVRFGPQNVGGIINFVSRSVPKQFGANVSTEIQSAEHGGVKELVSTAIGGTNDKGLGAALLYSGVKGDGYRDDNDHTNIDDVMLKASYAITERDTLAASLHYYDAGADMPGGLSVKEYAQNPFQSTRPYDDFAGRRKDASLKYSHVDATRKFEVLTYYTDSFRGSHIANGAYYDMTQLVAYPRNYSTFAIEPRFSQLFAWGEASHEVGVGYRYLEEKMSEKALTDKVKVGGVPKGNYVLTQDRNGGTQAQAVYIDDTISYGRWTVVPGLRYEIIDTQWRDVMLGYHREQSYEEPLPSINASYHLSDVWNVFANANTSFGPMQYFQIAQGGSGNQSANGLTAEKAHTYEVGTRYDDGRWGGEVTLFYIDFDNEMQYVGKIPGQPNSSDQWTNLGATKHQGIETAVHYDLANVDEVLKGLTAYATYVYTRATSEQGDFAGKDLPFYSRNVATLGARYQRAQWTFNVDGFAQSKQHSPGAGPNYITSETPDGRYGDIAGYATWNVRGEYSFGPQFYNMKLAAGIRNLFDREYYTRSTDNNYGKYVGQPRTYFMQASFDL